MERGPRLRIVSVNDVYSLEHLPRLATLIQHFEREDPADAFLSVLAGDFLAPSMLSSLDRGKGMVECLNAVGIGCVILGNHEDDIPVVELRKRILELRGTWLATNTPDLDPHAPGSLTVTVMHAGGRTVRVGLLGVVMTDPAVYRRPPFGGTRLLDSNPCVLEGAAALRKEGCDLVIPITHQSLASDRELVRAAAPPFVVIIGGHEHDVHVENDLGTFIVKAGSEAVRGAIVEIEWAPTPPSPGEADVPTVKVRLEPVSDYAEDPTVRALVSSHMARVHELEAATVIPLGPGETLSSVGSRARQVSMGTMICTHVRDALHADVCLVNGGGIRASRDYTTHLAYGDIKAELPFDNEMVVVPMEGRVLSEAVSASRAASPLESGGFLQTDDTTVVNEKNEVTHVRGEPLDPSREYRVATVRAFFMGMDHEGPLLELARAHPERIPPATSGRELKEILLEALGLDLWRKLGGFAALDQDGDGVVTEAELTRGLAKLFGEPPSPLTVTIVMNSVDLNHDRRVTREESDYDSPGST